MSEPPDHRSPAGRRERVVVVLLCLFAAARIFLGAASLPLFTSVDEDAHFDLVHKFSEGRWPGPNTLRYDHESERILAFYGTSEYLAGPNPAKAVPLWRAPRDVQDAERARLAGPTPINHEATSPPVYYAIAGAVYRVARSAGLGEGSVAYVVRFLNVLTFPALVALAYRFARRFYPDRPFIRLAVPTLLAAFPQDVFFGINSDAASPLAFLGALFLLLVWRDRARPAPWLSVATGLAIATSYLVKVSNLAILVVAALILLEQARRALRAGPRAARDVALCFVAAAVPIAAWLAQNVVRFGDLTGSAAKVQALGWTTKPAGQWLHHPIFTPAGLAHFVAGLIPFTWRGETVWHLQTLSPRACDVFFIICTLTFLAAATWRAVRHRRDDASPDAYLFVAVGVSVLLLAGLSIPFDFGHCWYPSREFPYFISGRLIMGALVPFLILLARGIEGATARLPSITRGATVAAIVVASLIPQARLIAATMPNAFNWFHLP